ncbi:DEAD/DEAH box helicase [Lactococcus lactis]|uniref:DEAD/DEAH box helicase n=1 Tax=Lactococcus lactis TaxID=1358 RepID=UPI00289254DF|nr:DEAD/DEAH box helicase [Lactococcus lactis]MDT2873258.1 DEAD/DEAH box helicase [Lactococcus lactis]MDT2918806.1 DEAD/DEAH box helicase [Lactococcus lactis]MDT2935222.1 DEAD/DEAH box helicase [Lactococcus lactis]
MTIFNNKEILRKSNLADYNDSFNLATYTLSVIDVKEGREIVIYVLEFWNEVNENTHEIWLDLIERAGFYPYFKSKQTELDYKGSIQGRIRSSFFKSDNLPNIYFHERQKKIEILISKGCNLAVSAPTSFGKSLLIEEIVSRKKFKNILIIQPTLSLIDETRQKLKKYANYNIIVNTKQQPGKQNIFILTAERVLEFPDIPKIDFFIVDEFYKVSGNRDNRIDALNIAIYNTMKSRPQVLFLTPVVDNLSENLREKYDIKFFKTDYHLVNSQFEEIRHNSSNKKRKLFNLLDSLVEPTIVYVKTPNEGYKLANEYINYLEGKNKLPKKNNLGVFSWIDENISPNWQLKRLLSYGVGVHNGAIPRHIALNEVEYFNNSLKNTDEKIGILFATTSLIEGVNTSAKNIIVFSKYKGKNTPIDYFDFANISGRAGRMGKYFTGNIYLFNAIPEKDDFTIDVPIVDQNDISDEIIVNLDREDVNEKERFDALQETDPELNELIKKNLIKIKGQKELVNYLENNIEKSQRFLVWDSTPTFEQSKQTLGLAYTFLHTEKEPVSESFFKRQAIISQNLAYGSFKKALANTFASNVKRASKKKKRSDILNSTITEILYFQRRDASFRIPKLLDVLGSLQQYVFKKYNLPFGDYSIFASLLENEQIQSNLQFLIDFGVPASAIIKIQKSIDVDISENEIKPHIRNQINNSELLAYEKEQLNRAIN